MPEFIKIRSEDNSFQHAEVLRNNRVKRSKNRKFFVEGVRSINLALENDWTVDTFLYSSERKLSGWATGILGRSTAKKHIDMPLRLMEKLSGKEEASELIALVEMRQDDPGQIKITDDLFVVVIDRASNPGNLGTIIRSCSSFGVDAILLTGHSVDLYDPKTIQASVGTLFSMPIIRMESHNALLTWIQNVRSTAGRLDIIGTTVKTEKTIDDIHFRTPMMLLIGNETHGLSSNYKEISDQLVKIPIIGSASSLNVACATSIFLYEIRKQLK